jgi:hypothetical protein
MGLEKLAQLFPMKDFSGQKSLRNGLLEKTPVAGRA